MHASAPPPAALPFLAAYLIPLASAIGLARGGPWSWSTVVLVFIITPVLDAVLGLNTAIPDFEPAGLPPTRRAAYDLSLWLWLPLQLALLGWGAWAVAHRPFGGLELAGLVLSLGISSGAGAITVAHELMHRRGRFEKALAELLMTSVCYPHFCIEHLRGHHRHVATPADPATARLGETLPAFLPRTLLGGLASAWRIERELVRRGRRGPLGLGDRRLRYPLLVAAALAGAWLLGGTPGAVFFLGQATVAVLLLEIINYVEHYGLERRALANGRFERVGPQHSWNAAHRLTNWYLFNLQRHADHHVAAARPFWLLRHLPESPQLPAGYAAMCLLALVPPLWRLAMDARAAVWRAMESAAPPAAADDGER